MSYGSVTITTSATKIVSANTKRKSLELINTSEAKIVYYGPDNSITSSNALPLYETQTRNRDKIPEGYLGDVWGITASGTADLRYWETVT